MSRVYLAGPLFCAAEKWFNERVTAVLEQAGYTVFLPQRDGVLAAELQNKTTEEMIRTVFEKDTGEVRRSDVLLFVLDGRVPDEGACVELGLAYAMGKRCYGIRTDVRSLEDGLPINPLIAGCFKTVFESTDSEQVLNDLKDYLDRFPL